MKREVLLDILIPAYKRQNSLLVAAESVLSQIVSDDFADTVRVTICDDCSPSFEIDTIARSLDRYRGLYSIQQNKHNKGMSLNIFDMVSESTAEFCTILTDDDKLENGALRSIVDSLKMLSRTGQGKEREVGAVFTPRYSYTPDGMLHCIECRPFSQDTIVMPTMENTLEIARNSFILTGLLFKPKNIDFEFWKKYSNNAFFPLLYFASISVSHPVAFLDRKWFYHTCLNECHWEHWGETKYLQNKRLHSDYLKALRAIRRRYANPSVLKFITWAKCIAGYWSALGHQFASYRGPISSQLGIIAPLVVSSPIIGTAYAWFLTKRAGTYIRERAKSFLR